MTLMPSGLSVHYPQRTLRIMLHDGLASGPGSLGSTYQVARRIELFAG
jgi:hypothetical protein